MINLKYKLKHRRKNLNYLMDDILYQIFKTILSISSKNMRQLLIILQILGSTKSKINKDTNSKKVSDL